MRKLGWLLLATAAMAQAPVFHVIGTMSELMVDIIYPASDAIFYVDRKPPSTDSEWAALRGQALTVAESGNLLLMPGRARDQGNWVKDTKLMIDAGQAAFKAARAKDLDGVRAVSDALTESCVVCHTHYRNNYPKKR